jgi:gas vesicle protein
MNKNLDSQGLDAGASPDPSNNAAARTKTAFNEAKEAVKQTFDEVSDQASKAANSAREKAEEIADRGKAAGVGQVEGLARAVQGAADELEEQSPEIAKYVRQAADGLQQAASTMRNKSIGEMVDAVQDLAGRQPAAFFGSTVLAGFVLSRFLKSRADRPVAPARRHTSDGTEASRPGDRDAPHFASPDNLPSMSSTIGEMPS